MAEAFYELRKSKGVTPKKRKLKMDDVMYFGTMLLKDWSCRWLKLVALAHATKDVLHPGAAHH